MHRKTTTTLLLSGCWDAVRLVFVGKLLNYLLFSYSYFFLSFFFLITQSPFKGHTCRLLWDTEQVWIKTDESTCRKTASSGECWWLPRFPQAKQPEGLTVTLWTARSGCCVRSCRLLFVPSLPLLDFKKKKKKKPWSPFCILKLHPVQKCSGKICSCTVSWRLLNVFWFGKFLSAFLVAASRLRNQERRTLAAQHRGPEAGTFRKRWLLESQMLKKWFCLSTLVHTLFHPAASVRFMPPRRLIMPSTQ